MLFIIVVYYFLLNYSLLLPLSLFLIIIYSYYYALVRNFKNDPPHTHTRTFSPTVASVGAQLQSGSLYLRAVSRNYIFISNGYFRYNQFVFLSFSVVYFPLVPPLSLSLLYIIPSPPSRLY